LRQLLEEGFFHADPHPGNLVATDSGSLAYFDFGMMGDIPRHYRVGLIQVVMTSISNFLVYQLYPFVMLVDLLLIKLF
jgi:predicted unusual protein kinase regulating ubiquinone biosynthesis (AarF/ABC1/UbiB family)